MCFFLKFETQALVGIIKKEKYFNNFGVTIFQINEREETIFVGPHCSTADGAVLLQGPTGLTHGGKASTRMVSPRAWPQKASVTSHFLSSLENSMTSLFLPIPLSATSFPTIWNGGSQLSERRGKTHWPEGEILNGARCGLHTVASRVVLPHQSGIWPNKF